jgi:medium-chain acyl-[acyl-carrier-protein] hydrolase
LPDLDCDCIPEILLSDVKEQQSAVEIGAHKMAWFVRPRKEPQAPIRLFCFPHAGGAASAYHRWGGALPAEVLAVQLPGREGRLGEQPVDNLDRVVRSIADAIQADDAEKGGGRPFAFFGHSMGSLLAYETARELRRRLALMPVCLFVSGRAAPTHVPDEPMLHRLPDDRFIEELDRRFNGLPAVLRNEPELMALFLPVLRADLKMLETHAYRSEPPLDLPLYAYGGIDDLRASLTWLEGWSGFTTQWQGARQFAGGHFYLHSPDCPLLAVLSDELETRSAPNRRPAPSPAGPGAEAGVVSGVE